MEASCLKKAQSKKIALKPPIPIPIPIAIPIEHDIRRYVSDKTSKVQQKHDSEKERYTTKSSNAAANNKTSNIATTIATTPTSNRIAIAKATTPTPTPTTAQSPTTAAAYHSIDELRYSQNVIQSDDNASDDDVIVVGLDNTESPKLFKKSMYNQIADDIQNLYFEYKPPIQNVSIQSKCDRNGKQSVMKTAKQCDAFELEKSNEIHKMEESSNNKSQESKVNVAMQECAKPSKTTYCPLSIKQIATANQIAIPIAQQIHSNKQTNNVNITANMLAITTTTATTTTPITNITNSCTANTITTTTAHCTTKQWHQFPFLKSQSLDNSNELLTINYNMQPNFLSHLPEVTTDHIDISTETPETPETTVTSTALAEEVTTGTTITKSTSVSTAMNKTKDISKFHLIESRPIYPNIPYSPYASPRTNRRRPPLRESRRISIERSGSFLQLNQYKLMDQIGQGSYGLVKLAYSEEDSTHYAMKILSKRRLLRQAGLMKRGPKKQSMSPLDRVYREIAVLKKLDHPNIVKLIEVLDDPIEDSLYMVFELVQKGEVLTIPTKEPLNEDRAWSVFRDTLLGLEYLHYQRIVHADLKPSNLLVTDCGHVKIADLGVCNEFLGEDAKMSNGSTAGTPAFRAPETLNIGQYVYCGKAADIWALGITLYCLVYGNIPFSANSIPVLYETIKRETVKFPENPEISDNLKDCIQLMLNKDPQQRITLPQLKNHAWVTAGGTALLPTEEENCRLVQIDDDDINSVVRSIPKLDTLILIKTMLKNHSFGNPFMRSISGRAPQRGGSRLERFVRAGRSNSAPGAYANPLDRQYSADNLLPALSEQSTITNNDDH